MNGKNDQLIYGYEHTTIAEMPESDSSHFEEISSFADPAYLQTTKKNSTLQVDASLQLSENKFSDASFCQITIPNSNCNFKDNKNKEKARHYRK